jgi:hypothetical protein
MKRNIFLVNDGFYTISMKIFQRGIAGNIAGSSCLFCTRMWVIQSALQIVSWITMMTLSSILIIALTIRGQSSTMHALCFSSSQIAVY